MYNTEIVYAFSVFALVVDNSRGVTYNYDIRYDGALVIETGSDGTEFVYDYRDTDNLNSAQYTIGLETRNVSYQYDGNGNNTGVTLPNNATVANVYNSDDMLTSSKITTIGNNELQTSYIYTANNENIASIANPADGTLTYTYDGNGNILTVSQNNVQKLKYTYDSLNQLVREDNAYSNQSYTYAYDVGGNITSKSTYAYTTGELGIATSTVNYSYGDSSWKDLLTSYDGNTINYDEIGNPLSYNGWTFTWQRGRQLASATKGSDSVSYVYNDSGIRTSKTVNGTTTNYFLDSTNKVIGEQNINNTIWYYYDSNDKLIGFELNGTPYYYIRNAQGDVTSVVNSAGNVVAKYFYDAWGNIISMTDSDGTNISNNTTHVGYLNPYRYRGYRYDVETGFYYLQSRYYNPQVGRFINADDKNYLGFTGSYSSYNLNVYCDNNPVIGYDENGTYNRSAAIRYARKWWYRYNKQYKRNDSDCANFVSQCLYAGGVKMTATWYHIKVFGRFKISQAWGKSSYFRKWLLSSQKAVLSLYTTYNEFARDYGRKRIQAGDVLFFDDHGNKTFTHTGLLGYRYVFKNLSFDNIFYWGHTNPRSGDFITNYGIRQFLNSGRRIIVARMK